MTSTSPNLDAMQLLDIGQSCSSDSCYTHDFLPLSCPCCTKTFCSDHWKPVAHACPSYSDDDNVVQLPICPLCNKVISIKAGQDPNVPMDAHLLGDCSVLRPAGNKRKKPVNECRSKRCRTKMISPITCPSCRQSFCAEHRYPKDHDCSSTESSVRSSNTTSKGPASTNAGLAALARVRRSASKAIASSQSSKPQQRVVIDLSADSSSESDVPKDDEVQLVSEGHLKSKSKSFLPSAADKRAKAERASQMKGLENRAKKGLLSEKEKVQYATLQAAQAKDSGRKKEGECIIL